MELKVEASCCNNSTTRVDSSVRHQFDVNKLFLFFRNEDVIKAFDCICESRSSFDFRLKSMGWDEDDLDYPSQFTIGEMKEALVDYIMYDVKHYYKPHSWYTDSEVKAIIEALTDLGLDYEKDPFLRTFKTGVDK